jgi:hypothetical protein
MMRVLSFRFARFFQGGPCILDPFAYSASSGLRAMFDRIAGL